MLLKERVGGCDNDHIQVMMQNNQLPGRVSRKKLGYTRHLSFNQ
jgi:hypothetical protein